MSNITVNPTFSIIRQRTKKIRTRIQSLNSQDNVIGEVRGYCTGGSLEISNSDLIRRSLNMEFVANSKLEVGPNSPFWINKRLKVFTGVDDYNGNTYWFDHGIFVPTQVDTNAMITGRTMALTALDKMHLADNPALSTIRLRVDEPITECLKMLADEYGEKKFLFDDIDYTMPHEYELLVGDSIQEAMKEVANMYMGYDVFYNTDGYLCYSKQQNRKNDAPIWDFSGSNDFTTQRTISADYTKIYNNFMVYGYYDDETASQPKYHLTIEDDTHPFSVNNMGYKHTLVVEEDTYTKEEQCKLRAEYEKQQAENLINNFSITTVPIYPLNDVNRVINVTDNGNRYTCLVDTISYPFNVDGVMTIGCHEIFE